MLTAAAEVAWTSVLAAGGVTVTVKVRWVQADEAKVSATATFVSVLAATVAAADSVVVVSAAAVVVVTLALLPLFPAPPAAAPPKVNAWLASAVLQLAMSMALPLTVKQEPAWFSGWKASGPAPPLKLKSCELVTWPPTPEMVSCLGQEPEIQIRPKRYLTSIATSTAGEEEDLVSGRTARIKVETSLGQGADDEDRVRNVVMLAAGNNVPTLAICRAASGDLDRRQVLAKVSRELVNKETPAVGSLRDRLAPWMDHQFDCQGQLRRDSYLDLDIGKSPGGGVIPLLSFRDGGLIQRGNSTGKERNSRSRSQCRTGKNRRECINHFDCCFVYSKVWKRTGSTSLTGEKRVVKFGTRYVRRKGSPLSRDGQRARKKGTKRLKRR